MSFEDNIKTWVSIDNEIRLLNNQLKILKEKKGVCNKEIMIWIDNKNLNNPVIKINDGRLKIVDITHQQPLTFKFVYLCLLRYFNSDTNKAHHIINFIKSNRIIKTNKEIKRYIDDDESYGISALRV